jgi:protease IV
MVKDFLYENRWIFYIVFGIITLAGLFYIISSSFVSLGVVEPQIYIIPVRGEIVLYDSGSLFGGGAYADQIVKEIELANEDPFITAIILDINSPGGSVVATREIATAIENSEKPVVAWIREVAASGGYWISASSDAIVADPASMTGSIGVVGSYLEYSELLDDYGIKYEQLTSGKYKDTGTPFREITSEEKAMLQSKIDKLNIMFVQHVSDKRNLTPAQVSRIKTAEFFLGTEAKQLGLVDVLGSRAEAITFAEALAEVDNSNVIEYSEDTSVIDNLLSSFSMQSYLIGRGIGDSMVQQDSGLEINA